jgi:signal transduction histidine kinase
MLGAAQFASRAQLDYAKALGLEDSKAKEILFRGALKASCEGAPAELKAEVNSEKHMYCLLDAQLLHSVLNNLIGNSLKFNPSGGHIVVSVEQKSDRGISRIRDTGSGMTLEQVKAIFKPFQQVSEEKQNRREGMGLGLSIVSQFTQLMSGTVDVESQKGEGTTFTLSFPP